MMGTERKKGFVRFFFCNLSTILFSETLGHSTLYKRVSLKTNLMGQMSRQISKVIKVKTKEDPKFISTFFMAATHLFWTFGNVEKVYCRQITCWPSFKKGVENCSSRLRCYLPLLNIAAVDSKIKSL